MILSIMVFLWHDVTKNIWHKIKYNVGLSEGKWNGEWSCVATKWTLFQYDCLPFPFLTFPGEGTPTLITLVSMLFYITKYDVNHNELFKNDKHFWWLLTVYHCLKGPSHLYLKGLTKIFCVILLWKHSQN